MSLIQTTGVVTIYEDDPNPTNQLPNTVRAPRYVLSLVFDPENEAQRVDFIQHDDQIGLLGVTTTLGDPARIADGGVPKISRQADLETNSATIASPTFVINDIEGEATSLLAEKWSNRVSPRYIIARLYEHESGVELSRYDDLLGTFLVESIDYHEAGIFVQCADIMREGLDAKALDAREWRLLESLPQGSNVTGYLIAQGPPADDCFFTHTDRYPYNPSLSVFYVRTSEDEIIAIESVTPHLISDGTWRFHIRERGALGTAPAAVTLSDTTTPENAPKLTEHPYYVETPASMLALGLIGYTVDGRKAPTHLFPGISDWAGDGIPGVVATDFVTRARWVNMASLARSDMNFPLTLNGLESMDLMEFVEREVLAPIDGVLVPGADGKLQLRVGGGLHPDMPAAVTYSDRDIDPLTVGPLVLVNSELANPITIASGWDWRTDTYRSEATQYDVGAENLVTGSGTIKPKTIEYRLLGDGFSTGSQRRQMAIRKSDRLAYPRQSIAVDLLPGVARPQEMDIVRLEISADLARNSYSGQGASTGLSRAFRVIRVDLAGEDGATRIELEGGFGVAQRRSESDLSAHLPDSWYEQFQKITDHVQNNGTELYGVGNVIAPGFYAHLGDLRIRSDFRCTFSQTGPMFALFVRGQLIIESPNPFDGTGNGIHPGGTGQTTVGQGSGAPSNPGYFGPCVPQSAFVFTERALQAAGSYRLPADDMMDISRRPRMLHTLMNARHNGTVPSWQLAYNNGVLTGIPGDPSGSGGAGSDAQILRRDRRIGLTTTPSEPVPSEYTNPYADEILAPGRDGGRGGMSIGFVSRGGGFAGSGSLVTDGADADEPFDTGSVSGPAGAGGAPGIPWWAMDGGIYELVDLSGVSARYGGGASIGTVKSSIGRWVPADGNIQHEDSSNTNGRNVAAVIAQSIYVPKPATLQDAPSELGRAFEGQYDRQIDLIVTDANARPSDANHKDFAIWRRYADSGADNPEAWIYDAERAVWRLLDWSQANAVYRLILENYRAAGGRRMVNDTERPEGQPAGTLWHNPETGIIVRLRTDGPPDELVYAEGESVGDDKYIDPTFAQYASGARTWVVISDRDAVPYFPLPSSRVIVPSTDFTPPEDGDTPDDPDAPVILPAPTIRVSVYSQTEAEVFITPPGNTAGINSYEISLNQAIVLVIGVSAPSPRYLMEGLVPDTTNIVRVRSLGEQVDASDYATVTFNTPPLDDPPPVINFEILTFGPLISGYAPVLYEGERVQIDIGLESSPVSSAGYWSVLAPASIPSQADTNAFISEADGSNLLSLTFDFVGADVPDNTGHGRSNAASTLDPVSNLRIVLYADDHGEVFWDQPAESTGFEYEVWDGDIVVDLVTGGAYEFWAGPGERVDFTVASVVVATGAYSIPAQVSIIMQAGATSQGSLSDWQYVAGGAGGGVNPPPAGDTDPTITVNYTTGRTISGTTTGVANDPASPQVYFEIGSGSGRYVAQVPVDGNGDWTDTVPSSYDNLAGQLFNPYVSAFGIGVTDPDGEFVYSP